MGQRCVALLAWIDPWGDDENSSASLQQVKSTVHFPSAAAFG